MRGSSLRFGRNTLGPVLPVGAPPSRALSAGNWASTLSVLTRLCPQAAHGANRSAIRTIVFREEGKPLPTPLPRGAARPEWIAPEFGDRLLTRARRSSVPVLSRAGRSFHAEPSAASRRRKRQSRGPNRVGSAFRVFRGNPGLRSYVLDDQGRLRTHVVIYVDGRPVRDRNALADAVGENAEIHVMQALSGG